MELDTARFGPVEIDEKKIITLTRHLPGFEDLSRFCVLTPESTWPIYWLQSLEQKHVALPVIDTFEVFPDYTLEVEDAEIEDLEIKGMEDLIILNVVVIPDDIGKMTANLAAPILVNARLGKGKQILVDSDDHPIRQPVFDSVYKLLKSKKGADEDAGTIKESE